MVITELKRNLHNRFSNIDEEQVEAIFNAVNFLIDRIVVEEDDVFNGMDMDIIHKLKNYILERNTDIFKKIYNVVREEADKCIKSRYTLIIENLLSEKNMNKRVLELHELGTTFVFNTDSFKEAIEEAKKKMEIAKERSFENLMRLTLCDNETNKTYNTKEIVEMFDISLYEIECNKWTIPVGGGNCKVDKELTRIIKGDDDAAILSFNSLVSQLLDSKTYEGWKCETMNAGLEHGEKAYKCIQYDKDSGERVMFHIRLVQLL